MARYGLREEKLTIGSELYTIKPLSGEFFAEFMDISGVIQAKLAESKKNNPELSPDEVPITLTKENYITLQKLATETLMAADNGANRQEVEAFASQNLMDIVPAMLSVNTPK
jgi:hypothetical protein